jgi:MFS transporter, DHA2 family, multidrug resistance protein
MTALLGRNIQISHGDLAAHITDSSLSAIDSSVAGRLGSVGDAAMVAINGEVNRQAAMVAYIDDFHAMMLINLCAIPLLLLLRRPANMGGAPMHIGE